MNVTEIARRLGVPTEELRDKLPELGFSIGRKAIKVNASEAQKIMEAWAEMKRRERLTAKRDEQKARAQAQKEGGAKKEFDKSVEIPSIVSVRDFASLLSLPIARVMQELMKNGILASLNESIDFETAAIVAEDLGYEAKSADGNVSEDSDDGSQRVEEAKAAESDSDLQSRPPVIVVMGHVDHGKTRLLDAIRATNVIDTEAGGITQHIGAYQVKRKEKELTFIDTPGHEAFTVMRSRGAKVADVAILVVAADDGVQPQTREAVDIIKAAEIPFIIALNKVDKPEANIERVKGELAELNLIPEDWGGKTICVPVSAKEGTGIDDVLDALLLVAEVAQEDIVANPDRQAIGTVIESHVDKKEGIVATLLVQMGTLRLGDDIGIGGSLYGRVRSMKDWKGENMKKALPSTPVRVLGLKSAPAVGDVIEVPEDRKQLSKVKRGSEAVGGEAVTVVKKRKQTDDDEKAMLNLIIRADVLGSLEAFIGMLDKIDHELVGVDIVSKGLGNITDADILKAEATNSLVYAFNVQPSASARDLARTKQVEIVESPIIYKLFEDVMERLQGILPDAQMIHEHGKFEVVADFQKLDKGGVVGGKVLGESIFAGDKIRILRGDAVVGEGEILKLQIGKEAVKEVLAGKECGLEYKSKTKIEMGDVLESYSEETKTRKLKIEGIELR